MPYLFGVGNIINPIQDYSSLWTFLNNCIQLEGICSEKGKGNLHLLFIWGDLQEPIMPVLKTLTNIEYYTPHNISKNDIHGYVKIPNGKFNEMLDIFNGCILSDDPYLVDKVFMPIPKLKKIYEKYSKLKDDFVVWYLHLTCSNYIESIKTHGLMDADNLVESGIISNAETHKIGDSTYDEETHTIVDAESFDADSFFKDNLSDFSIFTKDGEKPKSKKRKLKKKKTRKYKKKR